MLEMLVAEASKHSCFELVRGASVKGVVRTGDRVSGVRVRSEEGERTIDADLVIGADGRASAVRKHTGIRVRHADPPIRRWTLSGASSRVHPATAVFGATWDADT
jgi:2-polyprenyl-6-methoxyphenol hydroxylase-like FAD-dependent oxidoreductase